jgi:hypothetical protein
MYLRAFVCWENVFQANVFRANVTVLLNPIFPRFQTKKILKTMYLRLGNIGFGLYDFATKIYQNWDSLIQYHENIVCSRFWQVSAYNPRVQVFLPEYFGTIMPQDKIRYPKFDDYTHNYSEKQSNLKNRPLKNR